MTFIVRSERVSRAMATDSTATRAASSGSPLNAKAFACMAPNNLASRCDNGSPVTLCSSPENMVLSLSADTATARSFVVASAGLLVPAVRQSGRR